MTGFTVTEDCTSPEQRAKLWIDKLNALFDMDLPFHKIGIAHLTCGLMAKERADFLKLVELIDETEMEKVFARAQEKGVGIELNADDMSFKDEEKDIVLRPYKIAKKMGCKFYMGSDAHHPDALDNAKEIFERAIDLLELTEEDKFVL